MNLHDVIHVSLAIDIIISIFKTTWKDAYYDDAKQLNNDNNQNSNTVENELSLALQNLWSAASSANLLDQLNQLEQFNFLSNHEQDLLNHNFRYDLIPKLLNIFQWHNCFEIQLEAMQVLALLVKLDSLSPILTKLHTDGISLLVKLLSSPYDELAIKSLRVLQNYTSYEYVLNCGLIQELAKVITLNKSVQFLRAAASALKLIARGEASLRNEVVIDLLGIVTVLIQFDDIELICDIIWTLKYLTDYRDENVQNAIDARVIPRIFDILASGSPELSTPALKTLGNVVAGNSKQAKFVVDMKLLPLLKKLLTRSDSLQQKEIFWVFSNVAVDESRLLQQLINEGIVSMMLNYIQEESVVSNEAIWVISNAIQYGTEAQVLQLLENYNLTEFLCNTLLKFENSQVLYNVIVAMSALLTKIEGFPDLSETLQANVLQKIEFLSNHHHQSWLNLPANQLLVIINGKYEKQKQSELCSKYDIDDLT
ncbi:Importin subunit alpha-1 [Trichoplax sp. H2]|nr:Importin subunit alpha-1 [Trichoplax sp. H2]|eukprot:RDD42287.1 Importin subunit alpha-1 [Trichoplax sp. H2]